MPGKEACSKIADREARRRCMNYEGEFAKDLSRGSEVGGYSKKGTAVPTRKMPSRGGY